MNRKILNISVLIIVVIITISCSYKNKITATNIKLDPIYGSNMVFMRSDSIIIKGFSNANAVLAVKLQDGLIYVYSDTTGRWIAKFPPFDYKGAFTITIEGVEQVIKLNNLATGRVWVVIGDNWLKDSPESIYKKTSIEGRGSNENLRLYTPPSLYSEGNLCNNWETLKIEKKNYREIFSCILGDELSELNNETIGIINLSCTGTSIRDFSKTERENINSIFTKSERDSLLNIYIAKHNKYKKIADSSFKGLEKEVLDRRYDDSDWSSTEFPLITKKHWYLKNRIAWLRKKIFISEKYITSDFIVDLGTIRGQFDFYFNGSHIANFKGESSNYKLSIPDSLIKIWTNLLTVRMVAGDSLSGFYSSTPMVTNTDSTYRMQIAEDWSIRTYYEPILPNIQRHSLLWPLVYSNYIAPISGLKVNAILLTGSVHQYANSNDSILSVALKQINASFESRKNYIFLIPSPGIVDAMVNTNYYNSIRNTQMISAAEENWNIINTMDIKNIEDIQAYQREILKRLISELDTPNIK